MLIMRLHIPLVMAALVITVVLQRPAEAFLGFGGESARGTSGLDLVQGYDRNTVTTVTGRIAVIPGATMDPVVLEVTAGSERLLIVVGPRWYLQDDDSVWKVGDEITARGSKAQGKDGRSYLLAQWLSTSSGGRMVLRTPTGRPNWSGGTRSGNVGGGGSGQNSHGGSGMRHGR